MECRFDQSCRPHVKGKQLLLKQPKVLEAICHGCSKTWIYITARQKSVCTVLWCHCWTAWNILIRINAVCNTSHSLAYIYTCKIFLMFALSSTQLAWNYGPQLSNFPLPWSSLNRCWPPFLSLTKPFFLSFCFCQEIQSCLKITDLDSWNPASTCLILM